MKKKTQSENRVASSTDFAVCAEEQGTAYYFKENERGPCTAVSVPNNNHCSVNNVEMKKMCKTKSLVIAFILFVLFLITSLTVMGCLLYAEIQEDKKENLCTSSVCVNIASNILSSMDPSIDPCEDFYSYACGNWIKSNVIPEDQSDNSAIRKARDSHAVYLRSLLLEDELTDSSNSNDPNSAIWKVKALYKSCLDRDNLEQSDLQDQLKRILASLGGWPILKSDNKTDEDWDVESLMADLRLDFDTSNNLVDIIVQPDDRDSEMNILLLDQPTLGMVTRDYYLFNSTKQMQDAYLRYMSNIGFLIRPVKDKRLIDEEMLQLLLFETKLAEATSPQEERRDMSLLYNKMSIEEIQGQTAENVFNWTRLFRLIVPNMRLDKNYKIINYVPRYTTELGEILKFTDKRVVKNYILWRFILSHDIHLSPEIRNERLKYVRVLIGQQTSKPLWYNCIGVVNNFFGLALGSLYAREKFDDETLNTAESMISIIRKSFREMILEVDWMDTETKRKAAQKADSIKELIGYPKFITNKTALDSEYIDISIDSTDYLGNILRIEEWQAKQSFSTLGKPVNNKRWTTTPVSINAFYDPLSNEIAFLAGIFQHPFWTGKSTIQSVNYGGIGMIVGHELFHAFDDRGRQYDYKGNAIPWWSDESLTAFTEKAQCIIDQYSNYTINNNKVNGRQTIGENIADNGGIKAAFKAFKIWLENENGEFTLPGLNLDSYKLFFVSFGQLWCGIQRPEFVSTFLKISPHSPARMRQVYYSK